MSRLADLQHRPSMSPGCFLTLYQGQIQAQHTLSSTERKHGCRVPVEAKTCSAHRFDLDIQKPRQNPAAQREITPKPQPQSSTFITRPAFPTWAQCVRGYSHQMLCSTRAGSSLIASLAAEPAGRVLQVTRLTPKPQLWPFSSTFYVIHEACVLFWLYQTTLCCTSDTYLTPTPLPDPCPKGSYIVPHGFPDIILPWRMHQD